MSSGRLRNTLSTSSILGCTPVETKLEMAGANGRLDEWYEELTDLGADYHQHRHPRPDRCLAYIISSKEAITVPRPHDFLAAVVAFHQAG